MSCGELRRMEKVANPSPRSKVHLRRGVVKLHCVPNAILLSESLSNQYIKDHGKAETGDWTAHINYGGNGRGYSPKLWEAHFTF